MNDRLTRLKANPAIFGLLLINGMFIVPVGAVLFLSNPARWWFGVLLPLGFQLLLIMVDWRKRNLQWPASTTIIVGLQWLKIASIGVVGASLYRKPLSINLLLLAISLTIVIWLLDVLVRRSYKGTGAKETQ